MGHTVSCGQRPYMIGALAWVAVALMLAGAAQAQTSMRTQSPAATQVGGVIEGRVVDPHGTAVRGTAVTARDTTTGFTRTVMTTETGLYRIEGLPSGTYTVTTNVAGYAFGVVSGVVVQPSGIATANFSLTPTPGTAGAEPPADTRPRRVEVSGRLGWTLSDGVSGDDRQGGDGNIYNRVDPQDSASWGFTAGVFVTENAEIEFLYGRQSTTLEASGTRTVEVSDLDIDNYHGVFSYNVGRGYAALRPYVFFGVGVTSYGDISFTTQGQQRTIEGGTKFSTTFGGGLKAYAGAVGVRVEGRFTPTYIKSEDTSWWCDPYWGCYVVGNAQFANQFEFSAGLSLRF